MKLDPIAIMESLLGLNNFNFFGRQKVFIEKRVGRVLMFKLFIITGVKKTTALAVVKMGAGAFLTFWRRLTKGVKLRKLHFLSLCLGYDGLSLFSGESFRNESDFFI